MSSKALELAHHCTVDYLVIGAGSAGCVVASRLSESGRDNVLLLEAGGSDRRFWIQVPIGYGRTFADPAVNWMYQTEPDQGLNMRSCFWPRGKVVGGSGSINAMVYVRGQPEDFEAWELAGNKGWGWNDVLPYFRRSEDHAWGESQWHSAGGPMRVSDVSDRVHPLCSTFLDTCKQLGYPPSNDFNGRDSEGVGIYQINTRDGMRASTANAFLRPALRRKQLRMETDARVTRIRFEGKRACGVDYRRGKKLFSVKVNKEVILCAGAINSPQILQHSGVGDVQLLQRCGIDVQLAQPAVGRNLQDHLAVSYFYRTRVPTLNNEFYPVSGKLRAGIRYLLTKGGPLSMSVNQAGGFVRADGTAPAVNIQLYFNPVSYSESSEAGRRLMEPDSFPGFTLSFNVCRPSSRGSVEIVSADPRCAPRIRPNYLATDHDVNEVKAGIRVLRQIASSKPLSDVIVEEIMPGGQVAAEDELLEDFRNRASTVFHPVGTCAMGSNIETSVVDSRLRVHGVQGLRVIDASIFPMITSGNTNAPTVMVAEKGAAMLLEDNQF